MSRNIIFGNEKDRKDIESYLTKYFAINHRIKFDEKNFEKIDIASEAINEKSEEKETLFLEMHYREPKKFQEKSQAQKPVFDEHDENDTVVGMVRGAIVDIETGVIVANGLGHVQDVYIKKPIQYVPPSDQYPNGSCLIFALNEDETEYVVECDAATTKFIPYGEAVLIMIWKIRGEVHFSTQKQINAEKSAWPERVKIMDLWRELCGPESRDAEGKLLPCCDALFGDEKNSPFVHYYLLHGATRLTSPHSIKKISCIGAIPMWSMHDLGLPTITSGTTRSASSEPLYEVDVLNPPTLHVPNFMTPQEIETTIERPPLNRNLGKVETCNSEQQVNDLLIPLRPGSTARCYPKGCKRETNEMTYQNDINHISAKYGDNMLFNGDSHLYDVNYEHTVIEQVYYQGLQDEHGNVEVPADLRMHPGMSVIAYMRYTDNKGTCPNGKAVERMKIMKIIPPCEKFRVDMCNSDPNQYHNFVMLQHPITKMERYSQTGFPSIFDLKGVPAPFTTRRDKLMVLLKILIHCSAPLMREEMKTYVDTLEASCQEVANFIAYEFPQITNSLNAELKNTRKGKNVKNAMTVSVGRFNHLQSLAQGNLASSQEKAPPSQEPSKQRGRNTKKSAGPRKVKARQLHELILLKLYTEYPKSFYMMVKSMRNVKKLMAMHIAEPLLETPGGPIVGHASEKENLVPARPIMLESSTDDMSQTTDEAD